MKQVDIKLSNDKLYLFDLCKQVTYYKGIPHSKQHVFGVTFNMLSRSTTFRDKIIYTRLVNV